MPDATAASVSEDPLLELCCSYSRSSPSTSAALFYVEEENFPPVTLRYNEYRLGCGRKALISASAMMFIMDVPEHPDGTYTKGLAMDLWGAASASRASPNSLFQPTEGKERSSRGCTAPEHHPRTTQGDKPLRP